MKFTKFASVLLFICGLGILTSCQAISSSINGSEKDLKLMAGMMNDNLEMMKEAVKEGANINHVSGVHLLGSNPLWTVLNGQYSGQDTILESLIESGADINITYSGGLTLLMHMESNTDVKFCDLLIQHGAKIDSEFLGKTALDYALDHNNWESTEKNIDYDITALLENGAKVTDNSFKLVLANQFNDFSYEIRKRVLNELLKNGYQQD